MKSTPKELRELIRTGALASPQIPSTRAEGRSAITNAAFTGSTIEDNKNASLQIIHDHKLLMIGFENNYYVLGELSPDFSTMEIMLMVEEQATARKERIRINLYEREEVQSFCLQVASYLTQNQESIAADLFQLTNLLEEHREKKIGYSQPEAKATRNFLPMPPESEKQTIEFLSQPGLMPRLNEMIGKTGIVGEENTRLLLFISAMTYKMPHPIHVLVQGESCTGKSHLINTISKCVPPEDVVSLTRATSKSLYHFTKDELVGKLLLVQDFDGFDEQAKFAFRELQSAANITSSATSKDRFGNMNSIVKTVKSHFSSLVATKNPELQIDNISRSLVVGTDESTEQTRRIINYQNLRLNGSNQSAEERKAQQLLQNCVRCIRNYDIVNPFADNITLPFDARTLRRLNIQLQIFIKQVVVLHQYQRNKDEYGRLIATKDDIINAFNILFESLMLKVDELDSSLRQFFEQVKQYVKKTGGEEFKTNQFSIRELRQANGMSKTQCFRNIKELENMEYLKRSGGYTNRGYKYQVVHWDDMEAMRKRIKSEINIQLNTTEHQGNTTGTPEPLTA